MVHCVDIKGFIYVIAQSIAERLYLMKNAVLFAKLRLVKTIDREKSWKKFIFRIRNNSKKSAFCFLCNTLWNIHINMCLIAVYSFSSWFKAEYLYLMKLRVSNANDSVGQGGRSGEKVKNGHFLTNLRWPRNTDFVPRCTHFKHELFL